MLCSIEKYFLIPSAEYFIDKIGYQIRTDQCFPGCDFANFAEIWKNFEVFWSTTFPRTFTSLRDDAKCIGTTGGYREYLSPQKVLAPSFLSESPCLFFFNRQSTCPFFFSKKKSLPLLIFMGSFRGICIWSTPKSPCLFCNFFLLEYRLLEEW